MTMHKDQPVDDCNRQQESMDSQFAPFLEDIIDSNDLPLAPELPDTHGVPNALQWITSSGIDPSSKHILQEMSIVQSRIGFDEHGFREKCQRVQAELCQEFKKIVDGIYDALDEMVANFSKAIYQTQVDHFKNFDSQLLAIRRTNVQAATMEQSIQTFLTQIQQAYKNTFDESPS